MKQKEQKEQKEQEVLKEYDVFISYSRRDYVDENDNVIPGNEISKILKRLQDEGIRYWFDVGNNYKSKEWPEILVNSIEAAKIFVFLSTENANKSEMTNKEIGIACEFEKPIIPVRIDTSHYDKTVMFWLVNVERIDYYKNAQAGLDDLVTAINNRLNEIKEEERKKILQEELDREKKEEEERIKLEKKKAEEEVIRIRQQQLIDDISNECIELNSDEGALEVKRVGLLKKTELIKDEEKRAEISEHIKTSSPIYEKARDEFEQKAINSQSSSQNRKLYWIFGIVIFVLLVSAITAIAVSQSKVSYWKKEHEVLETKYKDVTEKKEVNNILVEDPLQGNYRYTGTMVNGLPEGHGKANRFKDGTVLEGTFKNGIIMEGKCNWKDGSTFVGPFTFKVSPNYEKGVYNPSGK